FIIRQSLAVLPVTRECVEAIHYRQNSGADWDLFALESGRVTGTVPTLVVTAHDRNNAVGEVDTFQDLRANHRMRLNLFEFFRRFAFTFEAIRVNCPHLIQRINGGNDKHRSLPSGVALEQANELGQSGTEDIERQRPEVIIVDYLPQAPSFRIGQNNNDGNN